MQGEKKQTCCNCYPHSFQHPSFVGKKILKKKNVLTQKLNTVFEARRGVKKEGKTQRSKDTPDKKENLNLPDKGGSDLIESRCAAPRSDSGCDSLQLANPPPYTHTHTHTHTFS